MIVSIYIDNQKLDLFEDESISIVSSILNIQDININTTEYSKSFTVPASNINNNIFKHYYNADIDNVFDARIPETARIELGGILFVDGEITLQKAGLKNGVISFYMLTFYGKLVTLKEIFGSDKLSDLDFSAFDETYNGNFIKALLTNNKTPNEILLSIPHRTDFICSLLSNRQYFYASNTNDFDETISGNLWYNVSALSKGGIYWEELKPSFLIRSIIEQIESDYSINITGGFFDLTMFDNLYVTLDNGSNIKKEGFKNDVRVDWSAGTYLYIYPEEVFINISIAELFEIKYEIEPKTGYENKEYTASIYINDILEEQIKIKGTSSLTTYVNDIGEYTIRCEIKVSEYFEYTPAVTVTTAIYNESATTAIDNVITFDYIVSEQMPDMTILDFLKGLIQLYKLVVIPTTKTDIYINNVTNYYSEGSIIDLTKYVNSEQIEVLRANLLNKITYNFQEPTTILNKQFKNSTGQAYGDEELYLYDESGKLIDGGSSEIKVPFEQLVYERLYNQNNGLLTNIIYGALIDEKLEPINIKPHIHYAELRSIGTHTIAFNSGGLTKLSASYYAPSHTTTDEVGLIFGSEVDEWDNTLITSTLYSEYYSDYINNLFNKKRRNYILKCNNLPLNVITDLRLNDIIKIGNNYYRINKFTTDITKGSIQFELFNINI